MSTTPSESHRWWVQRAKRVCVRVNAGWWLQLFLPSLLILSVVAAVSVLLARHLGFDTRQVFGVYGVACGLAAGACFVAARRRFESTPDGLVRLEARHHLRNRLTAAAEGVGAWPSPVAIPDDGLSWAWKRSLWHPLVSVALLIAALLVPVRPARSDATSVVEEPLAWDQMEAWADTLQEQEFLDENALQKLREQIQQLRSQPMDEWYSHSSLEAGDSLKQQTEQAIRELQRDLQAARSALAALEPYAEALPVSMQDAWETFMGQTLEGLDGVMLPIDPELLSRLAEIDPSRLRQLTPEELKALMEALAKGELACKQCDGSGTNLVAIAGVAGANWGIGGITRGPGEAPLFMKEDATRLGTTTLETLQNTNFERAALGDTLAVGEAEHEIDESLYQGPQAAGTVAAAGEGGETVWRTPLPPDEQDVLKRYFK